MMKHLFLICIAWVSLGSDTELEAQGLYFVTFTDKAAGDSLLSSYMSPEAAMRRELKGTSVADFYDWPVNEEYVHIVAAQVDSLRYRLRWFNAVTVQASPEQIHSLSSLPFVKSVEAFEQFELLPAGEEAPEKEDKGRKMELLLQLQRDQMQLDTLAAHGLNGSGLRIAILDAGFKEADTHPAFEQLRKAGGIIAARDFYSGKADPYFHTYHGTGVLGCIAGTFHGKSIGAAPQAKFMLARTENFFSEKAVEEDHWLAAMEWADSLGADIISSSLGYTKKRYTYEMLDGNTSKATQAASIAAGRGIVVVNSLGNEGAGKWHYLGAPADAAEIISVGGTYPQILYPAPFTSFGPNAAGVLKPEISAPGYVVCPGKKGDYTLMAGTSFACPLISGFAACLLQQNPGMSPAEVKQQLEELGHLYPYFDYRLGYGVPQAKWLFHERDSVAPAFEVVKGKDTLYILLDTTFSATDTITPKQGFVFHYHIEKPGGGLADFKIYRVPVNAKIIKLPAALRRQGRLRIWFKGYMREVEEISGE